MLAPRQSGWEWSLSGKLVRSSFSAYFGYLQVIGTSTMSLLGLEFVYYASKILEQMNRQPVTGGKIAYNSIALLIQRINQIIAWPMTVAIAGASVIFICAFNASVKRYEGLPQILTPAFVALALGMAILAGQALNSGAGVLVNSSDWLDTYKVDEEGNKNRKYFERECRSLQPVSLICGGFGEISKVTMLNLYAVWLDQSVSVLLAFA